MKEKNWRGNQNFFFNKNIYLILIRLISIFLLITSIINKLHFINKYKLLQISSNICIHKFHRVASKHG
jgi:hypothetical protein